MQHLLLKRTFLVVLVVLLSCLRAKGQSSDTLRYALDLQFGGQRKTGIFTQNTLRVNSTNHVEKGKFEFNNFSSYTYTEVNGGIIADDWDFRTILLFKPDKDSRILPALAHSFHSNVLYQVKDINRGIIGLRTIPFENKQDFTILIGAGYEHSNYSGEVFENSRFISSQRSFLIGFANISGKHQLVNRKLLLNYNLSFVQSMRETGDYWLWLTAGLNLPLSKVFLVGLNYDFRFRNVHLKHLPKMNDLLIYSLKIKLSN